MAITYPLAVPTSIGFSSVRLVQRNTTPVTRSVFTLKEQTYKFPGEAWEGEVRVASSRRDVIRDWLGFLAALRGATGTFLIGDPAAPSPDGTISAGTLSGDIGDEDATVTMTGSLLRGDYIQLGSGNASRLHMVTEDLTGDGTLNLWPSLRTTYASETIVFSNAVGVFRLAGASTVYETQNDQLTSVGFNIVEALNP